MSSLSVKTDPLKDPFKVLYKKYRKTNCGQFMKLTKDLNSELVDLDNPDQCESLVQRINYDLNKKVFKSERFRKFENLFRDLDDWKFFSLNSGPTGLILIPNVFRADYSKELFDQLLYNLPNKYYKGLKSNVSLPIEEDKIRESNLRWFTFGFNYDWTNKIYSKEDFNKIPTLLDDLLTCLKELLNLNLVLEAGIVNYYTCKSKLNPHSDSREENLEPSLLSLSLGEKCIFLIGTNDRYKKPITPLILRNGDLMIMSSESRLAYHSVVKIVCEDEKCKRKRIKRININVRQVY